MKRRNLLMSLLLSLLPLLLAAQVGDLPRSTPAAQGIDTRAVIDMMDSLLALSDCEIHHVMVVRNGHVVAELHPAPYRADDAHTLYSASKTFTALAVGLAIDDNRLRLSDRVAAFFPDKCPDTLAADMAAVTVRDLLMMATGIKVDDGIRQRTDDWVRGWLAQPLIYRPGQYFQYDTMGSFMLAAIVQRVTGKTMLQYLDERVFQPMHITVADWEQSPDGINTGGWGLRVQAETLAKLGILLLNHGNWQGRQLISREFVDAACAKQIDCKHDTVPPTDGNQGYGYQVWRSKWPGSYRADGAFGQYVVMVPQCDLVVVINGMRLYGHAELACIWNQLMPGVHDQPLTAQDKLQRRLNALCRNASLSWPQGKRQGDKNNPVGATLTLQDNDYGLQWLKVENGVLHYQMQGQPAEALHMGYCQWQYSALNGVPPYSIKARNRFDGLNHDFEAAAACAWTSPTTLVVRVHHVNWLSATTFVVDFTASTVTVQDNFPRSKQYVIPFTVTHS